MGATNSRQIRGKATNTLNQRNSGPGFRYPAGPPMKTCITCGKIYRPTSGHRSCPPCRKESRKKPCPTCGTKIHWESTSCVRCYPATGPNSNSWKGGKTRHKKGYIMVLVRDHPRAPRNNGYVFEHILVMEGVLGRILLEGECVHHKNRIRDDNRPDNLELWTTAQPAGARVSDLIEWAEWVLRTYKPNQES